MISFIFIRIRRGVGFFESTFLEYFWNIMAEGFRFKPLDLVRLRTFRLSAWVTYVQH